MFLLPFVYLYCPFLVDLLLFFLDKNNNLTDYIIIKYFDIF